MKTKNKISYALSFLVLLITGGCKDYLNVNSDTQKVTSYSFKTIDDLRGTTGYLYAQPWYEFNSNAYIVLEGRANNLQSSGTTSNTAKFASFMEDGSINELLYVWESMYNVITQSDYIVNDYVPIALQNNLDTTDVNACEGEARFMRGTAYWYLAMLWHDVPIIEDPKIYTENYVINTYQFEDVIQYAINDLTYAVNTLLLTDDAGRVTKYSAEGMLARICLTAADYAAGGHFSSDYLTRNNIGSNDALAQFYFSKVKALTTDVITNGSQYGLMDDYEELFRVQNNNNKEALFSLQFVAASTVSGLGNGNGSLAYSTLLTDGLPAYGGSNYASYDVVHLSALDRGLSRSRANFFIAGQKYSYLSYLSSTAYTGTKCNIKKQVVGSSTDADGTAISGNSGLMTPMLRMADVYLMYTEACMGTSTQTNDPTAVSYFNKVRARAFYYYTKNSLTNPVVTSTVVMRDTLFKERRLEFFMENLFWPDIVRRSFYDQDWATSYLNNKLYRSNGYTLTVSGTVYVTSSTEYSITDATTLLTNFQWFAYTYDPTSSSNNSRNGFSSNSPRLDATYTYWGTAYHNDITGSYVHATGMDNIWALPYPTVEATYNPLLLQAPIKYKF